MYSMQKRVCLPCAFILASANRRAYEQSSRPVREALLHEITRPVFDARRRLSTQSSAWQSDTFWHIALAKLGLHQPRVCDAWRRSCVSISVSACLAPHLSYPEDPSSLGRSIDQGLEVPVRVCISHRTFQFLHRD